MKTSLSLPTSLRQRAQLRANATHRGNLSGLIQTLLEADLAGHLDSATHDAEIAAKLATTYAGHIAPRLTAHLRAESVDQPTLVHDLLVQLQELYACGHSAADAVVVPRSELRPGHKWYQPPADIQAMAAEDPAPYHAGPTSPAKSPAATTPPAGGAGRATSPVPRAG